MTISIFDSNQNTSKTLHKKITVVMLQISSTAYNWEKLDGIGFSFVCPKSPQQCTEPMWDFHQVDGVWYKLITMMPILITKIALTFFVNVDRFRKITIFQHFYKNWCSKLIFFNEKFFIQIRIIFDVEIQYIFFDQWSSISFIVTSFYHIRLTWWKSFHCTAMGAYKLHFCF